MSLNQGFELKSEEQTRKVHQFDIDNGNDKVLQESMREGEDGKDDQKGATASKKKESGPTQAAAAFHLESLSKNETRVMRAFLLSS